MDGWGKIAAVSLAGLLATFPSVVAVAGAASAGGVPSLTTSSAPAGNASFDPRPLPALPQEEGTGAPIASLRGVVLDGSGALSTSLSPRLSEPAAPAGMQARYEVRSFAGALLWNFTTTAGHATVPMGVLRQGGSYTWSTTVAGRSSGKHLLEVDAQRLNAQRLIPYGDAGVTSVTGEPIFSAGTVAVSALPGTAGVTLTYQPSNGLSVDPTPGVPAGWRMETGAGWNRLHRFTAGRVELSDPKGRTVTFTSAGSGVWVPRFGPGRTFPAGTWVTLAEGNGGKELSVTDRAGTVTTFPAPTAATPTVRATSSWSAAQAGFTRTYEPSGRLTTITDPVSNRSVVLTYSGSGECPAVPNGGGFIAPPSGMLCAVAAWDGQRAEVAYSGSAAHPHIARVTVQAQASPQLLGQTDLGYDSVGRLATIRGPQVNRAIAAGVLNGFGAGNASDPHLLTSFTYDARGRVTRIQRPSAIIAGSTTGPPERGERRFDYPAEGSMRVLIPGRERPAWTHVASASTMLETKSIDSAGRVTTQSWDVARQLVTEARLPGGPHGRVKRFAYDALGNVRSVVGPSTTPDSPQAPRATYAYDTQPVCPGSVQSSVAREAATTIDARCTRKGRRTTPKRTRTPAPMTSHSRGGSRSTSVTGPVTEPMKGLQTTYWSNRGFSGTPTAHSTGPLAGAAVPQTLHFIWPSSPTGTPGWTGRLQGFLSPPATGAYTFRTGNGAHLVVGDTSCRPTCTLNLTAAHPVPIRVDVTAPESGTAGIDITWRGPGGTGAVPTSVLRPGYPTPTRVGVLDDLGSGLGELESLYVFDGANPEQVVESVSPSGNVQTRSYEPFDPGSGSFGRATAAQLAPGRSRAVAYYGGTETAAASDACRDRGIGDREMIQGGNGRTTTVTGGFSTTVVGDGSGRLVSQEQSVGGISTTTVCNEYDAAGNVARSIVPGATTSDDVVQTYALNVSGNPLVTTTTNTTGDVTRSSTAIIDLLGRLVSVTDAWGTTTVTSYDALDRAVYKRSITSRGEATDTRVTFTDDSQIKTVTVDGTLLATVEYAASTGDLVGAAYANGAHFRKSIGTNLDATERLFTVGATTMRETFRTAPSGRALDRLLSAPGAQASWQYRYDRDSRLTGATLSGSLMPDGVTAGVFAYSFDEQSRRTRVTSPGRDAIFAYDDVTGRMTSTTDPRFPGDFEYDARGRATVVGPLQFTYGNGSQVLSTSDTTSGVTVSNILDASGVIGQTISGPGGAGGTVHYSAQGLLLRGDGSVDSRIVPLPGGVTVQRPITGPSTWRYADGRGNIAWQAQGSAAPATTAIFDPDGNRLGTASQPSLDPARPDLGWAGAGGLVTAPLSVAAVQMGTRTYIPALASFLQPDPVPGGAATPYAYVPDPINATDSSGALPEWASTVIKVAVATVVAGVIMAKTAGTGAVCAKVIFQNIVAGAFAGATGEAAAQGSAIGVDALIDGEIEEHNEWSWGDVGIAAAAGAGAEAGAGALAAHATRPAGGLSKMVDDAMDEAMSGLSATDDLISGAGLNIVNKADDIDQFVAHNVDNLNQLGLDKNVITKAVHDERLANLDFSGFEEVQLDSLGSLRSSFARSGSGSRKASWANDAFVIDDPGLANMFVGP